MAVDACHRNGDVLGDMQRTTLEFSLSPRMLDPCDSRGSDGASFFVLGLSSIVQAFSFSVQCRVSLRGEDLLSIMVSARILGGSTLALQLA